MDNHDEHKKGQVLQNGSGYALLFVEIKTRIQASQVRAILTVNSELIQLYWDIGHMIDARQKHEGWGAGVIPRLARELKNEMPELKGFRNEISSVCYHFSVRIPILIQLCRRLRHN